MTTTLATCTERQFATEPGPRPHLARLAEATERNGLGDGEADVAAALGRGPDGVGRGRRPAEDGFRFGGVAFARSRDQTGIACAGP